MGSLTLPASGRVYVDTNPIIYTVQEHARYAALVMPLWEAVRGQALQVITSELTLLEVLTGCIKTGDEPLANAYETFLNSPGCELAPITREILRTAARLRATTGLKTPDAIHAATALFTGCALFVTNDPAFRRVPELTLALLDDVLAA